MLGQTIFNSTPQMLKAALDGYEPAYVPEDLVQRDIVGGWLILVLDDSCQPFTGYHLYYPSHRQSSPAFNLVVDTLRYRG